MKQFVIDSRFVCDGKIAVSGKDFHYLIHVRRYRVGSEFPVTDENGVRCKATVTVVSDRECLLSLSENVSGSAGGTVFLPQTELILIQCLPKAKKMDTIVRQAAEAGVARVMPAVSRYCISRPDEEAFASKVHRWRQIAREAVQQSGSAVATAVDNPLPFSAAVAAADCDCRLFFHHLPLPERIRLHDAVPGAAKIAFLIGPEGGLSDEETDILLQNGWRPVYLGKNILRCETAPLYAAAAINIILEECRE